MTAVLNGFRERAEKVAAVIAECRRLGIEVRPPDVQKSHALFTVETDGAGAPEAIRFGLAAIKNIGEGAIEAITAVRDGGEEPGPFTSLDDFCRRVDLRTVNKRVAESLVKANAMASLGTASALLAALDGALENGQRHQRDVAAGQSTLFDLFAPAADASVRFLDGERRSRAESGCAGRRSSSACTCRSTRWATSPTCCPSTSPPTPASWPRSRTRRA